MEEEQDFDESVPRKLVLPGDKLIEGNYRSGSGTYSIGNAIYSSIVGLMETRGQYINVIPIKGPYIPKVGDFVIGTVVDTSIVSWKIDLNCPYQGTLHATNFLSRAFNPLKDDIRQFIDIEDVIYAEIISFNRTRDPVLSVRNRGLGKLKGGRLVEILPTKIPRIIGRKGSMINLIKDATQCKFKIGQNGIIWLQAKDYDTEFFVVQLLKKIEQEAHKPGLTDRIKDLVANQKKGSGLIHGVN